MWSTKSLEGLNYLSGCSKCWKLSRESLEKPDYSGFDFTTWRPREGDSHKALAEETLNARTKTARAELESASGVRYSELFRLPYFDPIKAHLVDPMHNVLLGTAKHAFNIWLKTGLLDDKKVEIIDKSMKEMGTTRELGRTVKSMALHKTMKAEEWKNWVLVYSLYCLKDIMPKAHYNLWQIFVRACKLLLTNAISRRQAEDAHQLLALHCTRFQHLYGSENCTPNMHLHLHLKECILQYGPVYGFWAFSFERYNGILGEYNTNNRSITITLMRKFIDGLRVFASYGQIEVDNLPTLGTFSLMNKSDSKTTAMLALVREKQVLLENDIFQAVFTHVTAPKLDVLCNKEIEELTATMQELFPQNAPIQISKFVRSYERVLYGREMICTRGYRGGAMKDHFVMVRSSRYVADRRPAEVCKIINVDIKLGSENYVELMFLRLSIFEEHPQKNLYGEMCPMKVWSTTVKELCFAPLNFVLCKACFTKSKVTYYDFLVENCEQSRVKVSDVVYFVI